MKRQRTEAGTMSWDTHRPQKPRETIEAGTMSWDIYRPQKARETTEAGTMSWDTNRPQKPREPKNSNVPIQPPEFWDSLPTIKLTWQALREVDRRNRLPSRRVAQAAESATRETMPENFTPSNELQAFARHGGPELSDLRNHPQPLNANKTARMSIFFGSKSLTNDWETSAQRSSAYDTMFEVHLIDNNIYPEGYAELNKYPTSTPSNLEEIVQRLQARRSSISPDNFESTFQNFQSQRFRIRSEAQVMTTILPMLLGQNNDIPSSQTILFTNIMSITKGKTVQPKPDLYDGVVPDNLDSRIRQDLESYIVPTKFWQDPILPNLFIEVKTSSGNETVAKRQAFHDCAIGARGIHRLQSYGQPELVYDNNAYTISMTYVGNNLKIYVTHPSQSTKPDRAPQYRTMQIYGCDLTGDLKSFCQGVSALRNARDWAQEQRKNLILSANRRVGLN